MIKLSVKGLAKFMMASHSNQRKILRDYKYPAQESFAKIFYYKEALDRIVAYHKRSLDKSLLLDQAHALKQLAMKSIGLTRTRHNYNAKAIENYVRFFGNKKYEMLPDIKLDIIIENIRITAIPDLHVIEKKKERMYKLELSKDFPDENYARIISQVMYEAQMKHDYDLSIKNILFVDVNRGKEYCYARKRTRLNTDIIAACENIEGIWDTI